MTVPGEGDMGLTLPSIHTFVLCTALALRMETISIE